MFVGSRELQVKDEATGIRFPTLVHYPTGVPSTPTAFGPYTMDVSPDAPVADGQFPLVVISHGGGGSHLLYRTISTHLAKNGYVVAMPEHPGNNRNNNELADTHENLVNRPRHIRITIDTVSLDARFNPHIDPNHIAIIGHSIGGYTALAVAGGVPWSKAGQRVAVVADPRVGALVLLAPATAFFIPDDSLIDVTVPILMLVAEHDSITPLWQADIVLERVPDRTKVTHRVIEGAGHFSFLSPFPSQMRNANFRPSTDPEGFDRERFHEVLPGEVLASVVEHRPAALVQLGALYVLDDEGRLFKRAAPEDALDLPILTGVSRDAWDERKPELQLRLFGALHLLDTWQASGNPIGAVSEVRLDEDGGFTLFAHDGTAVQEVRLGSNDISLKLRRLAQVRAALARRGERASRIDLDNPARPDQAAATLADKR